MNPSDREKEINKKPRTRRGNRPRKVSRYVMHPSETGLYAVREFLRTTLKPFECATPHIGDIVTATHEACKNAVIHNPKSQEQVDIVCEILDDSIVVEVLDKGPGFDVSRVIPPRMPDPHSPDGRGLFIIYSLMDKVEAESGKEGTRIRMKKMLQ